MNRLKLPCAGVLVVFAIALPLVSAQVADPAWWSSAPSPAPPGASNPPPPVAGTPSPLAVANAGQLKYMAFCATQALKTANPTLGAQVESELVGSGKPIPTWDKAVSNVTPLAAINIGQLKAVAAPFYSVLHTAYPAWVHDQLDANGTRSASDPSSFFPWSTTSEDDENKAIASVGQLKAVFALRFEQIVDADNDGMMDAWELLHGYNPSNPDDAGLDSDSDGLTNLMEYRHRLNPMHSDTDLDGMPDLWEVMNGTNPRVNDTNMDPDGDTLYNSGEFYFGTDPLNPDTDADGMSDGWEASFEFDPLDPADAIEDEDCDGLTNLDEFHNSTDPRNPDTDHDGMPDGWEVANFLNPRFQDGIGDYDNDGWDNLTEFLNDTDPWFADYDNDGLEDNWEILYFSNLHSLPTGDPDRDGYTNLEEYQNGTSPLVPDNTEDTDLDGMWDRWELLHGLIVGIDDGGYHADSDGVSNLVEFQNGTNPRVADTDGDGIPDGWELQYGLNPLQNDASLDPDGDGRSNLEEFQQGTNPTVAQSPENPADLDNDGMFDIWELANGLNPTINDSALDPDNDGLTNLQEFIIRTNPKDRDTDSDLLPDLWEYQHGLNPRDASGDEGTLGDPDSDNLTNLDEYQNGSHPRITDTDGDGMNDGDEVAQGSNPSDAADQARLPLDPVEVVTFHVYGDWAAWEMRIQGQGPRDFQLYSVVSPKDGVAATVEHHLKRNNKYRITMKHTGTKPDVPDIWYCIEAKVDGLPVEKTFAHYSSNRIPGVAEFFTINGGKWLVDNRDGLLSAHHHKDSSPDGGGNVVGEPPDELEAFLVPMEEAPEVLAVNSDFDEGRIDPVTGYAIPDCDDTHIALEAVRNHLDGKFAINERVTDDLHPVFFGVNPNYFENDFWAGANVTIRKIEKPDPATGHPESGHVRLYGKWGSGPSEYRAIIPYDFDTLNTTNLADGGVNGVPTEHVYGVASPFPAGTSFFIEGVHPGKITLEWRYQKGSFDFKHEQSFEVCTHKNALQWKHDLSYKIRLETSNDPSGEINTIAIMLPSESYKERMERASEYYDFYQDCFLTPMRSKPLHPQAMTWPGLARLAGSQVVGGLSDSEYARMLLELGSIPGYILPGEIHEKLSTWSINETKELQQALFTGARTIFQSVGWQMHAYRSSGYRALDWVETETGEAEVSALSGVWLDLRIGILNRDKALLDDVSLKITRREQNVTIVPTWAVISGLFGGTADWMFSILGKNSCTPSGFDFLDVFPITYIVIPPSNTIIPIMTGSLADKADRWHWIDPTTSDGILDTWNKHPLASRDSLVRNALEQDARRFSLISLPTSPDPFPVIPLPVWVWDDEDVP